MTRRRLLKNTIAGATIASTPAWFAERAEAEYREIEADRQGKASANDTIHVAIIGPGGRRGGYQQGFGVSRYVHSQPGAKVVAVCDVDDLHLNEAAAYFGPSTFKTKDFREIMSRKDIDAVIIGTPDHWHATISVAAMKAGKDVYCEKPLTLTISEGRMVADAAARYKRVFQTGSQQRSDGRFRMACELVRNGRLGKIKKVTTHLPTGPTGGPFSVEPVPAGFDWNMWMGPTQTVDYCKERTHGTFRWWLDYSGGMLTDWGAHHNDIAQWGLGMDGSGPLSVEGHAKGQPIVNMMAYTTFPEFDIFYTYPHDVLLHCTNKGENGVTFEGEDGWIFVSRERIAASDEKLLKDPLPKNAIKLYATDGHAKNWLDCIRTRKPAICEAEVGHRSVSVCHMANISLRLGGRKLEWDAKKERFNDDDANALLSRPQRKWS